MSSSSSSNHYNNNNNNNDNGSNALLFEQADVESTVSVTTTSATTITPDKPTNEMEEEGTTKLMANHHHNNDYNGKSIIPKFTRFELIRFRLFSPVRLLILLCIINIFIYFDRGAISAVVPFIEKHWTISKTQQGALASAFMIGYMIFCPIFAELASRVGANILLAVGLVGWSITTFACGLSGGNSRHIWGYYMLVTCRCLVGIGEAAFAPIAPTLIDDSAPDKHKTTFMSIFYVALPCGVALGYAISGFLAARVSWRMPFFVEGIAMLLFAFLCLLIPPTDRYKEYEQYREALKTGVNMDSEESISITLEKTKLAIKEDGEAQNLLGDNSTSVTNGAGTIVENEDAQEFNGTTREEMIKKKEERKYNILQAVVALLLNPTYVFAALSATMYTFVVGGLAFWAPTVVSDLLGWTPETSNLAFSAVCVVTGLFGSFFGGIVLDFIGGAAGMRGASRAFLLCTIYIGLALPLGTIAFLFRNPVAFFIFLSLAELFVFAITSPMNVAFLGIVPKNLRNFSMSFQIFVIHLFGDMPSPVLFGFLADAIGKKSGVLIAVHCLWAVLALSVIFFFFAWLIAKSKANRLDRIEAYMKAKREAQTQNQSME